MSSAVSIVAMPRRRALRAIAAGVGLATFPALLGCADRAADRVHPGPALPRSSPRHRRSHKDGRRRADLHGHTVMDRASKRLIPISLIPRTITGSSL